MSETENLHCDNSTEFLKLLKAINITRSLIIMYLNARSCSNLEVFDKIKLYIDTTM